MKAILLLTGHGASVILTSFDKVTDPALLGKLWVKGIDKFIAYEIPLELAKQRYGGHFTVVMGDQRESDELRVLDIIGDRAFKMFHMNELSAPIVYEAEDAIAA